jgi:protocatechuate 3,4-dioxygenase beta subunit
MTLHSLRYFPAASGLLAFLFLASNCAAQNASLTGVVKDPQGAVVPIAVITLTDIGKHTAAKTVTSSAGTYEFPILQPGEYELKADPPAASR